MRKKVTIPMNYNDIAAMLAAGKTTDEIAKEFTDALNKAAAEQKAESLNGVALTSDNINTLVTGNRQNIESVM